MARTWQLQEAKSRFSEVVNEAIEHGPQIVSRHGEEAEDLDLTGDKSLPRPNIEL